MNLLKYPSLEYTNLRIKKYMSRLSQAKRESAKYPHIKEVDLIELKAFLGLKYYRGMLGLSKHDTRMLWGSDGPPVFAATMSEQRFIFLRLKIWVCKF